MIGLQVPTLQVVQSGFRVVVVSTVTQRIDRADGCRAGIHSTVRCVDCHRAPRIVVVSSLDRSGTVHQPDDIPLLVQEIVIEHRTAAAVLLYQRVRLVAVVIDKIQIPVVSGLMGDQTT